VVIYAISYALFREKVGVVALVFIYAVIFGLWLMFLMPTQCDYITQRGGHCTRTVRGKLNGCASHARMKRDALFGAVGKRNPGTGSACFGAMAPRRPDGGSRVRHRRRPASDDPTERSPAGRRARATTVG
jgi:hypothetical protein